MLSFAILDRIEEQLSELGISASRASIDSGNSRDLIRNWQRARDQDRSFPGKLAQLDAIAKVLNVPIEWLLNGTPPGGFADDATPYTPRPVPAGVTLDSYLAPNVRQRLTWRTSSPALWLGILAGDLLVIDMHAAPKTGETVLAAILDGDTTQTRLMRYVPPFLISGDPAEAPIPSGDFRIQGPVVGIARGPGL